MSLFAAISAARSIDALATLVREAPAQKLSAACACHAIYWLARQQQQQPAAPDAGTALVGALPSVLPPICARAIELAGRD
eukprot:748605-Prymnesium_polylepis.1